MADEPALPFKSPRVVIEYCTQCKWMLRAAYVRTYIHTKYIPIYVRGRARMLRRANFIFYF